MQGQSVTTHHQPVHTACLEHNKYFLIVLYSVSLRYFSLSVCLCFPTSLYLYGVLCLQSKFVYLYVCNLSTNHIRQSPDSAPPSLSLFSFPSFLSFSSSLLPFLLFFSLFFPPSLSLCVFVHIN